MPQTTNAVPMSCARIDFSSNDTCTAWTTVSGSVISITSTQQTKMTGEIYTNDGVGAIVMAGKQEPFDMAINIVFTNVVTEAYRLLRDTFLAGACDGYICIRYIPSGVVGGDGFQTNYAPVTTMPWPEVDAGTAGPIAVQFTLRVSTIDPFVFVS